MKALLEFCILKPRPNLLSRKILSKLMILDQSLEDMTPVKRALANLKD